MKMCVGVLEASECVPGLQRVRMDAAVGVCIGGAEDVGATGGRKVSDA